MLTITTTSNSIKAERNGSTLFVAPKNTVSYSYDSTRVFINAPDIVRISGTFSDGVLMNGAPITADNIESEFEDLFEEQGGGGGGSQGVWGQITGTLSDQTDLNSTLNTLAGDINGIQDMIPAQASDTNQLADKNFVNSSINTMAANRVTYDAAGSGFPTKADLTAATVFYHGGAAYTPTAHDYCIVLADESAPAPFTGGQTRYEYDGAVWAYVYGINEEPFTASETAALESGVTAAKVAAYDAALSGGGGNERLIYVSNTATDVEVYTHGDLRFFAAVQRVLVKNNRTATVAMARRYQYFQNSSVSTPAGGFFSVAAGGQSVVADVNDSLPIHNVWLMIPDPAAGVYERIVRIQLTMIVNGYMLVSVSELDITA